jgi:hypothetical protein
VSERFIWISSQLLFASMLPLAVALTLDIYLIGRIILGTGGTSAAIAAVVLIVVLVFWIVLPWREQGKQR